MDTMIFQQTFTIRNGEVLSDENINIIPCCISSASGYNNYQPTPAEGSEAERILQKLEDLSSQVPYTWKGCRTVLYSCGSPFLCLSLQERALAARFFAYFLIRQPLASVFNMNDPAVRKSILFQKILHHHIVPVRVDPEISALSERPIQTKGCRSLHRTV